MDTLYNTKFAPAERLEIDQVFAQSDELKNNDHLNSLFNTITEIVLIVNEERQVIYSNKRLLEILGVDSVDSILGQRPGEILNCVHSDETPGGCGTTESCKQCGAVIAMLMAQKGKQAIEECRILAKDGEAFDLKICATPYKHDGKMFGIIALTDISDEKRRGLLERTFFHDVLNTASCVLGFSEMLTEKIEGENRELSDLIHQSSNKLINEIQSHRFLLSAEKGELQILNEKIQSKQFINEVVAVFSGLIKSKEYILSTTNAINLEFESDRVILGRVLGNMIKNALEASEKGGQVTISCSVDDGELVFDVHNTTYMPKDVQSQIFKRSFSTKGEGRGVGTYSIKLFVEKYLKGRVWFTSAESYGTNFYVALPM
jgi:signal transduction histidine kinase